MLFQPEAINCFDNFFQEAGKAVNDPLQFLVIRMQ